ncbi:hypothetical protein BU16DRAFT_435848, partial [Lophium mytilinum]
VHEELICAHSPFFKNAMKPEWAEMRSDPRAVHMPDDDAEAFELYMQWLYVKHLPIRDDESPDKEYLLLAKAFVLGEEVLDDGFKQFLIDAIIARSKVRVGKGKKTYFPEAKVISVVYQGTPDGSPIRRLFVDFWTWIAHADWM